MKTKMFKSAVAVLLTLLLLFSVAAPAASAAAIADMAALGEGEEVPLLGLHTTGGASPSATVSESDVKQVFDDLALGEGDYYGIRQKDLTGSPTNLSGSSDTASVSAGAYIVYRTAVTAAGLTKTPDWDAGVSQEINIRLYHTAVFSVSGCDEGAVLLNGEAVSGEVRLYTDTACTVTAKQVEGYSCTVNGAPDGEPFTPDSDLTVTAVYYPEAHATVTVNKNGEGSVKLLSDGMEIGGNYLPVGTSFTVEAEPNAGRGYQPGSLNVTKNGTPLEGTVFGPAADGDVFEVNVTFTFAPEEVGYEVSAASPKLKSADFNKMFNESGSRSYGYATVSNPNSIKTLGSSGTNFSAGAYIIYSAPYNKNNPDWSVAKVKKMNLRTYYTGSFTVTGNADGGVYLNDSLVEGGTAKLYTDTKYTVAAKQIDAYFSVMTGAAEGAAFAPTGDISVKVAYYKEAHAVFTLSVNGVGTAAVKSDGVVTTEFINEGSTFTVEATPNTDRGYKLDNITVTRNGEEVAATDGAYGPAADGESYAITVNFKFEPSEVSYDLHASKKLTSTILNDLFGDSLLDMLSKSYGFANVETPSQITVATTGGHALAPGAYYIYRSTSKTNWSAAKVLKLNLRTYYNGTFTVTGSADGALLLNGKPVSGKIKLYTGTEYTPAVKPVEGYDYILDGLAENTAFTPSADVTATLTYSKPTFATFTLHTGTGGTATVYSGGFAVTDQINDGAFFTVEPNPYTDRGYKPDSIVVTKDGEPVEPVDGAYGPVADGESYVITVSFKFDPDVVSYNLHADKKLTSTILNDLFGDSLLDMLSKSYGFASVDAPDKITTATTGGNKLEPGEYYIYRSGSSSDWSGAKVLRLKLRTYYDGSFAVSGHDEGALYLNGQPKTGSQRLYTDREYTVTVKQIEGYICTLYGAEDGVTFTPSADMDVTAAYIKDAFAEVTVSAGNGGSVKLVADGNELFDKIPEGSCFTVVANANAGNAYYVENITVTKNGEPIEPVDGAYGPAADGEKYAVSVTFARASLTFRDGEVSLSDIFFGNHEAVEQGILKYAAVKPEKLAENAEIEVEYVAYTLLGISIYEPLTYQGDTGHLFGTSERGGTLKGGNTEKVRITVNLPDYDIELRATAVMTVSDDRVETTLECSAASFTITYGDDLKAAILDSLTVTRITDGAPVEFTADDLTVTPEKLNAGLLSAQNAQEVTVRYNGSEIYAGSETTVSVYVRRAPSTMDAENETVIYGETPAAAVITTPENLDHLKVIAGIDGNVDGFVSINVPDSVKERMKIKIAGITVLDIYQLLTSYIGEDGASIEDLKNAIGELNNLIASSDTIREAIENSGFNVETLENVMRFISELPTLGSDLRIRLEQTPKNAGTYLMFAISTDANYTTSESLSYIIILPKSSAGDDTVALRFKNEMQTEGDSRFLTYSEAQSFDFGGRLYVNDEPAESDNIRTLYVGTTLTGDIISQSEPVREPGVYTETVFMLGGNYIVTPIIREFTIRRNEAQLMMDDLTVTYDGAPHALTVYADDDAELTGSLTYLYTGVGYLSSRPPVNAGEYTVLATYSGDRYHRADTISAKLTIKKREAVVTVSCRESFTYGELTNDNLSDADLQYTISGLLDSDRLGLVVPVLNTGFSFPNVGSYTATARVTLTNNNYSVTIKTATLTITPQPVVVKINAAQKQEGDEDPAFTYRVTDKNGKRLSKIIDLTLEREEGETPGTYRIFVAACNEKNYMVDTEASVDGVLTIKRKPYLLGDANSDGAVTIKDVTAIQRYLAEEGEVDLQAADVDGNGTVDIADATALQLFLSEKAVNYPIGQTKS